MLWLFGTSYGTWCATNSIKSKVFRLGDSMGDTMAHTQNWEQKKMLGKRSLLCKILFPGIKILIAQKIMTCYDSFS